MTPDELEHARTAKRARRLVDAVVSSLRAAARARIVAKELALAYARIQEAHARARS